jgi:hypothetical protein
MARSASPLPARGDGDEVVARFAGAGVDVHAPAARLHSEGAKKSVGSWDELITTISGKTQALTAAG